MIPFSLGIIQICSSRTSFLSDGLNSLWSTPEPGAHALYVTDADNRAVPDAVAMFELPLEDVGDYFHVVMRMVPESLAGLNRIVVDHPATNESP